MNKTHGLRNTRLYVIWRAMKSRVYNKNHPAWKNYGGRDIVVCDEWRSDFMAFYAWAVDNGYRDDLTIDRIDNDGPYAPDNCRWATHQQQQEHKRPPRNLKLTDDQVAQIAAASGESRSLAALFGVHETTIGRIRRGLRRQRALSGR